MVAVAQLVEPRVVISAVVGSSPIGHPILRRTGLAICAAFSFLLSGCATPPRDAAPKLFIAGDSTAATYVNTDKNQQGWGAVLQPFFSERKLRVVNAARGGRSSRTFITEGHWDKMVAEVRAGDYVIIQFGHNDAGALNQEPPGSTRPLRARGTIPGIGNETEEIDNVITGKHETVYSFGWYLRKMISDTRSRGATPVLMSLTRTNNWVDGRISCPSDTYRLWDWQTATNEKVAFVDLSRITADRYQREGRAAVTAQFIDDTVHTNVDGAERNAADAVSGLRALRELPFRRMLSAKGRLVPADAGPPPGSVCAPLPD
ncbi:MAG: lipolytic protein family [Steroidobacteraceae bacterium]|nr:lipolytic protein family [Steroidobacteraceae bacterium]